MGSGELFLSAFRVPQKYVHQDGKTQLFFYWNYQHGNRTNERSPLGVRGPPRPRALVICEMNSLQKRADTVTRVGAKSGPAMANQVTP